MAHPEPAWRAEIHAHAPQTCDFLELSGQVPDLSSWRAEIAQDPDLKECLEHWEAFIQANRIAVPIEQAMQEGALDSEEDIALRLQGCPSEWSAPLFEFFQQAPEAIRMYLGFACFCLVQIERQRRTGSPEWRTEAASGSPEVLRELMFKWGPRFSRHRWTW